MSWNDVLAALTWWTPAIGNGWGPLSDSSGVIRDALQTLYFGNSKTAQAILDVAAAANGGQIRIYKSISTQAGTAPFNVNTQPPTPTGSMGVNLSVIGHEAIVNNLGRVVPITAPLTIIHELTHAVLGTFDLVGAAGPLKGVTQADFNSPTFDLEGDTLKIQNEIAKEMKWTDQIRPSYYIGLDDREAAVYRLRTDISYTEGNEVGNIEFGDNFQTNVDSIDLSLRTDGKSDLVFGFDGNDVIRTGTGNDYIYGGPGDDTLSGGSGNNLLDGGDRKQSIAQDGTDTADYSIGDFDNARPHGVTVSIEPQSVPENMKLDGVTPIIVSDNGYGGTDRLISIEKIKLTAHGDTVVVGPGYADVLNSLLEVDGGGAGVGEKDVLDLTKIDKTIKFENNKIEGTKTEFKNFNVLKIDPGNDNVTLDGPTAALWKEVDFGNGNDTITSDDVNLTVNLGDGKDLVNHVGRGTVVNAGQGEDTFMVSDDALIVGAKTTDHIKTFTGYVLHGALGSINGELLDHRAGRYPVRPQRQRPARHQGAARIAEILKQLTDSLRV